METKSCYWLIQELPGLTPEHLILLQSRCQYCGLLLHSEVGSVAQLVQIPVPRLHRQVLRLQVATIQRKDLCPSLAQVQTWVREGLRINN